jgi:hypothetical protein
MYDVALCMEIVECQKKSTQSDSEDHGRKPSYWIAVQECPHALPKGRMNKTSVRSIRPNNVERVKQFSDRATARVI